MARLTISIDVPDDAVDTTLTDPLDLADDITGEYEDWVRTNPGAIPEGMGTVAS
jgi:hypothetical protein